MNFSVPPAEVKYLFWPLKDRTEFTPQSKIKQLMRVSMLVGLMSLTTLQVLLANSGSTLLQETIVTGKVTSSDDGAALPGVSVFIKGSQTGTVTDAEGRYTISAPSGTSILVFSFIGY